jgi:4-diphosphocytidyl-2-C-methyl-D-erythritol kinase
MITCHAHARLTLALDIGCPLTAGAYKGYHPVYAVKHRIDLHDTLEVTHSDTVSLEVCGSDIPAGSDNLCLRAVEALRAHTGERRGAHIRLHKRIPAAGGLAGGSSDAAAVLDACNRLWCSGLSPEALAAVGRTFGMDIPYFFYAPTSYDVETRAGIQPLSSGLSFVFVLVMPSFGVSTARAYRHIDYTATRRHTAHTEDMKQAFVRNDADAVVAAIHNDFEDVVFPRYPHLRDIRDQLLAAGCPAAFMSGSGSTMAAVARDHAHARRVCQALAHERTCTVTSLEPTRL